MCLERKPNIPASRLPDRPYDMESTCRVTLFSKNTSNAAFGLAAIGEVLSDKPKRGLLVKCADGAIKLTEVQLSGGKRMSGGDLLNGRKVQKGQVFTC